MEIDKKGLVDLVSEYMNGKKTATGVVGQVIVGTGAGALGLAGVLGYVSIDSAVAIPMLLWGANCLFSALKGLGIAHKIIKIGGQE